MNPFNKARRFDNLFFVEKCQRARPLSRCHPTVYCRGQDNHFLKSSCCTSNFPVYQASLNLNQLMLRVLEIVQSVTYDDEPEDFLIGVHDENTHFP